MTGLNSALIISDTVTTLFSHLRNHPAARWTWPIVGFLNACLIAIDLEMHGAHFAAINPKGVALPTITAMLGGLTAIILIVFGFLQIIHGFRKQSTGIRTGIITIVSTALSTFAIPKIKLMKRIGEALFHASGYGSTDFFYSPIFYLVLLIVALFFGVTRSLRPSIQSKSC